MTTQTAITIQALRDLATETETSGRRAVGQVTVRELRDLADRLRGWPE